MAQINIILFRTTKIRSFITAKATRTSAQGIGGISISTLLWYNSVSLVGWVFLLQVICTGLRTFNFLRQVGSIQTPQRKAAVPRKGLTTDYNSSRTVLKGGRTGDCSKRKRRGMRKWLKLFQILSTPEAFPQKPVDNQDSLSGMFEKEEARSPRLDGIPWLPHCPPRNKSLNFRLLHSLFRSTFNILVNCHQAPTDSLNPDCWLHCRSLFYRELDQASSHGTPNPSLTQ